MRPETRLDSAVFQLTPTRTRCDLVIIANGKKEKIASGLLNPFLVHLKTAQEQIDKGGYSVKLEPDPERSSSWFTKGTVERFVRFVSTPEVLERVTTIESEISQIENAIAIQSNLSPGLSEGEQSQTKPSVSNDGTKATGDTESEKAIIPYKPGSQSQLPDTNGSTIEEENSKVKLLKVLETRKIVLQKEQGMAFARAVAAGFDMDCLVDLISFAETFSASRLMEACVKFMDLWKKKHETGQWLEVEAAEISSQSEFSCLNTSGIILTADMMTQNVEAWHASNGDAGAETNGNADKQHPSDPKMPVGPQQYQHPMYSQWPMHPPPGPPGFQPYAVQGMPNYMNYPGGMPYFPPPYPPREDRRYSSSHKTRSKRHSMDNANVESETWERSTRSQDDSDEDLSDYEKESTRGSETHRKGDRSGKKKSGVVVIRNLNYITSRKHGGSGSESDSATSSEPEEENGDSQRNTEKRRHKNSKKSSTKQGTHKKHTEDSDTYSKDDVAYGLEADSGNWDAFQNFLLTAEDKARAAAEDMFSGEKAASAKKKKNKVESDPIVLLPGRDFHDDNGQRMVGLDSVDGQARRLKQIASNDALMIPSGGTGSTNMQLKEIEGGGGGYRRMSTDEFMIYGQEKQLNNNKNFPDPLVNAEYQVTGKADRGSSNNITDESFLLPHRSGLQDNLAPDSRRAIDIDSELTLVLQTTQDSSKNNVQVNYEPHDLSFVPERETDNIYDNYDPALDYDFQLPVENARKLEDCHQEEGATTSTKDEPKKLEKKSLRASHDSLERRKRDAMMKKIASSRLNPPADAQKRAEKLRAFKADMQKLKKEQEEENIRRLEALKIERQKRIAARSGSNNAQSASAKIPLQKLPTKVSRMNGNAHEVTRSASSLSVARKENNGLIPEAKGAHLDTKRLSVP